jgi:hypothetical protein
MYIAFFSEEMAVRSARGIASLELPLAAFLFLGADLDSSLIAAALRFGGILTRSEVVDE